MQEDTEYMAAERNPMPSIEQEFYFQWHITNRCNKRCRHCYHTGYEDDGELSLAQLFTIQDKIVQASHAWEKPVSLSLTGGEPFIRRKDLYALLERLHEFDCFSLVDILSNGSMITEDDCRVMKNFPLLRRIQLSLEGATKSSNDFIRGKGAFDEIISAIRLLKKHDFTVGIMMTITRNNIDEVMSVLGILKDLDVDTFAFERFIPEGHGAVIRKDMLTPAELKSIEEKIHAWSQENPKPHVLLYRPLMCLLDTASHKTGAMCSVGMNALSIMPDGTLFPCRRLPLAIGNILYDSIHDVWMKSPLLWQARNPESYKGKCGKCDYLAICRGCRAQAYAVTGDWLAEDPQCWLENSK